MSKSCGKVVTDGFISVKLNQEIQAATVINIKNANDRVAVYDPGCDSLLDLTAEVQLTLVNPDIVGMITGQELVLDYAGNAVGFRRSTDLQCDIRWALEVWTDVPGTACSGGLKQYGYFLVPCLRSATITGDITIDNSNLVSLTLTAKTTVPSVWGTGPQTSDNAYKVVPIDSSNTPGYLLSPIGSTDHDHMQLTTIAPPAIPENCGCTALTVADSPAVVVTSANPATAALAGGTTVEITGAGFTGATGVTVGGTAMTGVIVVDDEHLTGIVPAKSAAAYPVVVTTPAGTGTLAAAITYS